MTTRLVLTTTLALAVTTALAAEPIDERRAVDADARIEIENVRGSIEVSGWDRAEAEIRGSLGEGSKLAISGGGSQLVVRVEHPDRGWSWWGSSGPSEDTTLVLKVPARASIEASGVSADVRVTGVSGRLLEAETVSGDLRAESDAERIELGSVSGDIDLLTRSANLALESVSGDITARGAGGRVKAESVSGRIRLETAEIEDLAVGTVSGDATLSIGSASRGRIRAESMSGDVELSLPAGISAAIHSETFSGRIRSDFGEVRDEDHGPGSSLDVRLGDGTVSVDVDSFSGDVTIRRQ